MNDFEHLDFDPDRNAENALTIANTVTDRLDRPALVIGGPAGLEFTGLPAGADTFLPFAYRIIGARPIAAVALTHRLDLWYDEEFDRPGTEDNPVAYYATRAFDLEDGPVELRGPALLTGRTDEGETIGLDYDQVWAVVGWLLDSMCGVDEIHVTDPAGE